MEREHIEQKMNLQKLANKGRTMAQNCDSDLIFYCNRMAQNCDKLPIVLENSTEQPVVLARNLKTIENPNAATIAELTRMKCVFQLRTIAAVMDLPQERITP